jgi:hypothetical protein
MIIIMIYTFFSHMGNYIRSSLDKAPMSALRFKPETFRSAGRHSKQLSYLGRQNNNHIFVI